MKIVKKIVAVLACIYIVMSNAEIPFHNNSGISTAWVDDNDTTQPKQ